MITRLKKLFSIDYWVSSDGKDLAAELGCSVMSITGAALLAFKLPLPSLCIFAVSASSWAAIAVREKLWGLVFTDIVLAIFDLIGVLHWLH